jgi:hypothetical protein
MFAMPAPFFPTMSIWSLRATLDQSNRSSHNSRQWRRESYLKTVNIRSKASRTGMGGHHTLGSRLLETVFEFPQGIARRNQVRRAKSHQDEATKAAMVVCNPLHRFNHFDAHRKRCG